MITYCPEYQKNEETEKTEEEIKRFWFWLGYYF